MTTDTEHDDRHRTRRHFAADTVTCSSTLSSESTTGSSVANLYSTSSSSCDLQYLRAASYVQLSIRPPC
eukprot:3493308-Prymnesium_polylepis.1